MPLVFNASGCYWVPEQTAVAEPMNEAGLAKVFANLHEFQTSKGNLPSARGLGEDLIMRVLAKMLLTGDRVCADKFFSTNKATTGGERPPARKEPKVPAALREE